MIKAFLQKNGELTPLDEDGKNNGWSLCSGHCLHVLSAPVLVSPVQVDLETPGIVQIGRLYLLPTPFNSIVNGDKVDSLYELWLIILQNLTNIFLLYPLVLAFLFSLKNGGSLRAVMRYSFYLSLFIDAKPSSFWTSSSMPSGFLKWTTSGPIP